MDILEGDYTVTLFLAVAVVVLMFVYNSWYYSRLRTYGIPGPKGLPIVGNILDIIIIGLNKVEEKWTKQYGDIVGWRFGYGLSIMVKDPDVLKEVMVKDFSHFSDRYQANLDPEPFNRTLFNSGGKDWKRLRTIMSPTFSASKLKTMIGDINVCAETLANHFVKNTGDSVVVKEYLGAFTLDVIAATAFGIKVDSQNNLEDPFLTNCRDFFAGIKFSPGILIVAIFPWASPLVRFLDIGLTSKTFVNFFVQQVRAMISHRKDEANKRHDFLQSLLDAEMDADQSEGNGSPYKKMTTDEVHAQSSLFFLAGYETTASLLRFTSYLLATHTDVQDRLVDEINEQLGEEAPSYENISNLHYMEQVLFEALRMYPPISSVNRKASETRRIKDVTIPEGAAIIIPIYNIHHDERFYPDPETFDPERFAAKSSQSNNIEYLAFGYGPRLCLGMRLALVEAKIALVHVLRKVKFSPGPETQIPLKINLFGLVRPVDPIKLKVQIRN